MINQEYSVLECDETIYVDVQYEDEEHARVNGGYIFKQNGKNETDGGEFVLQSCGYSYRRNNLGEMQYFCDGKYEDTGIVVFCQELKTDLDYLIENYTSNTQSLFDNLDDVQDALYFDLAIYPTSVARVDDSYRTYKYPFLNASIFQELSISPYFNIYSSQELLFLNVYPFTLHSIAFPSTIAAVAKQLDSNCIVEGTSIHSRIQVTYNGETHVYGGAGQGSGNQFYSQYVEKLYTFDGLMQDYGTYSSIDKIVKKYFEYEDKTANAMMDLFDKYTVQSKVQGEPSTFFKNVYKGTWIRIDGLVTLEPAYAYLSELWDKRLYYARDTWVDGRYIDKYQCFVQGVRFGDEYEDVLYVYNAERDRWEATLSYYNNIDYGKNPSELPEEMILTHEEVEQLKNTGVLDVNTNELPQAGLIYDSTAEPGTPFTNE